MGDTTDDTTDGPDVSDYQIDRTVLADAAQQAGDSATPGVAPLMQLPEETITAKAPVLMQETGGAPAGTIKLAEDEDGNAKVRAPNGVITWLDSEHAAVKALRDMEVSKDQGVNRADADQVVRPAQKAIQDQRSAFDVLASKLGRSPSWGEVSDAGININSLSPVQTASMTQIPSPVQPAGSQPVTSTNPVDNSAMGGRGPAPVPVVGGTGYQPPGQVIAPSSTGGGNQAGSPASLATLAQTGGGGGQGPMPLPIPQASISPLVSPGGAPAPVAPAPPTPEQQAQDSYHQAVNGMALSDLNTANERSKAAQQAAEKEYWSASLQQVKQQMVSDQYQKNMAKASADLDRLGNVKEDPNRFFKSLSGPGQISALISVGLGAIGQSLTGVNGSPIQKRIDDDIAAQRQDFHNALTVNEQQRSIYGQLRTVGYSDAEAEALVRMKQIQAAQAAQSALVGQYSPREIQQRAMVQAQNLQLAHDQEMAKFQQLQLSNAHMQTQNKIALMAAGQAEKAAANPTDPVAYSTERTNLALQSQIPTLNKATTPQEAQLALQTAFRNAGMPDKAADDTWKAINSGAWGGHFGAWEGSWKAYLQDLQAQNAAYQQHGEMKPRPIATTAKVKEPKR